MLSSGNTEFEGFRLEEEGGEADVNDGGEDEEEEEVDEEMSEEEEVAEDEGADDDPDAVNSGEASGEDLTAGLGEEQGDAVSGEGLGEEDDVDVDDELAFSVAVEVSGCFSS